MNRDDVIRMAREAGLKHLEYLGEFASVACNGVDFKDLEKFANLAYAEGHKDGLDDSEAVVLPAAIKAEREKVAEWMMQRSYATGHGDTIEDLLAELDWQIAENWNRAFMNGVKTEREACAKVAESYESIWATAPRGVSLAIRERGAP